MGVFLEFHLIQNFAPSNLNRDDTGAPKDALFGGQRRARISSQCLKRATREAMRELGEIPADHLGVRTQKLKRLLTEQLSNRDPEEVSFKVDSVLNAAGLVIKDDGNTEYLLFLGQSEIAEFASLVNEFWDDIPEPTEKFTKKTKKETKPVLPPELERQAKKVLEHGGKAADIALYGRMLADRPAANQNAACQVAHAISTHRVEREFDYYTAVDDCNSEEQTGAGMIGQVEFNSATFYRYAVVDLAKLVNNLQSDQDLALLVIESFVKAMVQAVPSGKQNSFAARNLPHFVGICLRHTTPLSLANAFEKPVTPKMDQSLTDQSVERLLSCEERLGTAYGSPEDRWLILDLTEAWPKHKGNHVKNLDSLAKETRKMLSEILER